MQEKQYVKIVHFGLIGEAQNGDSYRHIVFRDMSNNKEVDFIVHKKKRPELWADIEKLEKGKNLPPYKGQITRFNGLDIVLIGDETLEEAFLMQKWKLEIQKRIGYKEAEQMRQETQGYCTNETTNGAMEIAWRKIDPNAKTIRFRYYEGKGNFTWSKWFEIV